MSDPWNEYSPLEREAVEIVSATLEIRDELIAVDEVPDDEVARVSFSDLYAYVVSPEANPKQSFLDAIARDARLRTNLDVLVERGALCQFGLAEAAAAGDIDHREEENFTLHLHSSTASVERVIIVINLRNESIEAPTALFARGSEGPLYKHALPLSDGGQIQIMVEGGAGILRALRDPNARVTLR